MIHTIYEYENFQPLKKHVKIILDIDTIVKEFLYNRFLDYYFEFVDILFLRE